VNLEPHGFAWFVLGAAIAALVLAYLWLRRP
jgi:hypothetical protein